MYDIVTLLCKPLLLIHLLIAANFLGNLFSCQTQRLLVENQVVRHFVGFMTVYMFVISFDSQAEHGKARRLHLPVALGVYGTFVLTTRMRFNWWTAFVVLLLMANALQMIHDDMGDYQSDTNPNGWTPAHTWHIRITQIVLLLLAFATIIMGVIGYMWDKRKKYKNQFGLLPFLLGNPTCNGEQPPTSVQGK